MPVDVRELMAHAAEEPSGAPDTDAILRRASQLRRRSLTAITAVVVVLAAGISFGVRLRTESQSTPKIAAEPHADVRVGSIAQFPLPIPNNGFANITRGPDRSLWFTFSPGAIATPEGSQPRLRRVTFGGTISEIPIPSSTSGITTGKDGYIYFGQPAALARISPATGQVESFPLPEPDLPRDVTAAPDGDIWVTQEASSGHLWRFSPQSATFQRVELPASVSRADVITSDSRSNIWVSDLAGRILRVDRNGTISDFPVPGGSANPVGFGSTTDRDGNLWFTGFREIISRITPTGHITHYSVPNAVGPGQPSIVGITAGPDGNVWFSNLRAQTIGRITPKGKTTEYPIKDPGQAPAFLAAGPDGNIWFTTNNTIGRITTGAAPAKRSSH